MKQWLKQVKVSPVNQSDSDRSLAQRLSQVQATKTASNNHNVFNVCG
jgi:hypothetical protein